MKTSKSKKGVRILENYFYNADEQIQDVQPRPVIIHELKEIKPIKEKHTFLKSQKDFFHLNETIIL